MRKSEKDQFLKIFGEHLVKIRKRKNMSQEMLSYKSDIDLSTLSRVERGIQNISIYNASKIAKALNIPPKELFDF